MAKKLMWTVAENISKYRTENNMSQLDLAKLIGWPVRNVQSLEDGDKGININTLENIADALGVLPQDLLDDWDE